MEMTRDLDLRDAMVLWLVHGEAATDSSGGEESWLYITEADLTVPDVRRTFNMDGHGAHHRDWYMVCEIRRVSATEAQALLDAHKVFGMATYSS